MHKEWRAKHGANFWFYIGVPWIIFREGFGRQYILHLPLIVSRSNTWWLRGKHSGRHWGSRETKGNLSTRRSWLNHEWHGWSRRTGSVTRFMCQMQIIKQTNVKQSRTTTKKNVFQRLILRESFVSFLWRKHYFRRRISTFVWWIFFEEPRIWTSGFNLRPAQVRQYKLSFKNVLTCPVAVMLQKYFPFVSVVPSTSGA